MQRLRSHLLAGNALATPHAVVSHMTAIQAQDFLGSLWAIGVRMKSATEATIEEAIAKRAIVRCWPMRGTLHIVAAEDVRWMLSLLAPRALARHRKRLEGDFGLDAKALRRCRDVAARALTGNALTRAELYASLEKSKITTTNGRGLQILFALAQEQVLCFGARRGKQPTFVLLDEWLASTSSGEGDLRELAKRYLASHGPATAHDFAWWAGVTPREARDACAGIAQPESRQRKSSSVRLLPAFDEYTVAYRDRTPIVEPELVRRINNGGGMISAVVLIDGRVTGTWKRTLGKNDVTLEVTTFRTLHPRALQQLQKEADRYAKFLGRARAMLRA
ncbi:MAG TPA: winged helix DNA-binding domain-containing protein [Thermoanaerobaculia bacterium]|nr:winged helix DNA-binding domain-containing protein [Thermoanaerobaculia bacterium]